jgi:hypothetical protein
MTHTQRGSASGSPDLLSSVRALSPTQFEHWVADIFRLHFPAATVRQTGGSGDRGVDIVVQDSRGTLVVQCKRYAPGKLVGSRDVQMLLGAMMHRGTDWGAFVTTSSFTAEARAIAKTHQIWLVGADELLKLATKYDPAIREKKRVAQEQAERLREQRHAAWQKQTAEDYVKYQQGLQAKAELKQKMIRREAINRRISSLFGLWFFVLILALFLVRFLKLSDSFGISERAIILAILVAALVSFLIVRIDR